MLGSEHRNAHVGVAERRDFGPDSIHLVAEDDADGETRHPVKEIDGVNRRLDGGDFVAALPDRLDHWQRFPRVLPGDSDFRTQRRLADGVLGRTATGRVWM